MNEQALAKRREYQREWNRKNKDKVKAYQEKYWNKKAEQATDEQNRGEPIAQGV